MQQLEKIPVDVLTPNLIIRGKLRQLDLQQLTDLQRIVDQQKQDDDILEELKRQPFFPKIASIFPALIPPSQILRLLSEELKEIFQADQNSILAVVTPSRQRETAEIKGKQTVRTLNAVQLYTKLLGLIGREHIKALYLLLESDQAHQEKPEWLVKKLEAHPNLAAVAHLLPTDITTDDLNLLCASVEFTYAGKRLKRFGRIAPPVISHQ